MDLPAVKRLCLEQGECFLEEHLEIFLDLGHQATIPDSCSGRFLEGAIEHVEWVLVSCGSAFTVEDADSPIPEPVFSQSHPEDKDRWPDPIAGSVMGSIAMYEPVLPRASADHIATETK